MSQAILGTYAEDELPFYATRSVEVDVLPIADDEGRIISAALGSAIEVTYTWKVEPTAKKIAADYRALVHFLDSHKVMLFEDDHAPIPPHASHALLCGYDAWAVSQESVAGS